MCRFFSVCRRTWRFCFPDPDAAFAHLTYPLFRGLHNKCRDSAVEKSAIRGCNQRNAWTCPRFSIGHGFLCVRFDIYTVYDASCAERIEYIRVDYSDILHNVWLQKARKKYRGSKRATKLARYTIVPRLPWTGSKRTRRYIYLRR